MRDLGKITATPNHSKRTFTIRRKFKDGTILKYRTINLSKEEFQSEESNTERDWSNFLKNCDGWYYKV